MVKLKQSDRQGCQISKKLLVQFSQGKLKDKTRVASGFSQQKVKVNSKQSDRQGVQGSKKLLVQLSQG
ncbi:hypothetical protein M0802_016099 [Mischocyttarus mexicanus]|nr:hypothetical protein M0802_016099 [Mischocyttarus mexicanus]